MPYRLVATDFDDTLVPLGSRLSDRNRAALARIRDAGAQLVIVSGRTIHGLQTQLRRHAIETEGLYLIGYNGATAVRADDGVPLFAKRLDPQLAARAAEVISGFDAAYMAHNEDVVYTNRIDHFAVPFEAKENDSRPIEVAGLADLPFVPHKILIGAEYTELVRVAEALRAEFGEVAEVTLSNDFLCEFTAKGVHKGDALRGLCGALGVPLAEVVVFGDNHNDFPMFGVGAFSVAVANAVPELLAAADRVTASCPEDGFAQVIEELFPG